MNIKSTRGFLVAAVVAFGCGGHNNGNGNVDGNGEPQDAPATIGDAAPDANGCGLVTCQSAGAMCGPIGDGCGNIIQCGSCPTGESCGGGGVNFQCGSGGTGSGSACSLLTCADYGADCGIVSDGCGGVTASCGTCPSGQTCGGGGSANICAGPPCVGPLCTEVNACTSMPTTSISGTVTAPGHPSTGSNAWATWTPDPIYGALVYIPDGSAGAPTYGVQPFASGVSCDTCSSEVTGSPMVSVVTGIDGTFKLDNVPCGTNIPIVIQLGRWRREVTLANVTCCANNALTNDQTHLPRVHTPGVTAAGTGSDVYDDMPLMAFDTGQVDTLHCVLRKIGVDDSEFTDPTGAGRVHFYKDNGARIDASTPAATSLYNTPSELDKYDMVLFECVGKDAEKTATQQQNVINYANAGGRVYATHFSYVWLTNDGAGGGNTGPIPFSQTATWDVGQSDDDSLTGTVDQTLQGDTGTQTRRVAFANWLKQVGATATVGQIPVDVVRNDFNAVSSTPGTMSGTPAQLWLKGPNYPLHYTFDTPINYTTKPTTQCGRVLFSDFHVNDASVANNANYPSECLTTADPTGKNAMTPQEQTLEFMLFDLASCVGQQTVTCTPKTCADFGYNCGETGDGCDDGVILTCGTCMTNQTCGGGGMSGVCGSGPMCTPLTCAEANAQCGIIGDGCGNTVNCGDCTNGQVCGGNGQANQCGGTIQ
ncbi:MAG TPA: hypothetical protein VGG28_16135 [Kofleriaceae bacterium]|jgi:hypothetical protein